MKCWYRRITVYYWNKIYKMIQFPTTKCLPFPNFHLFIGNMSKKENFTYFEDEIFNFHHVIYSWQNKWQNIYTIAYKIGINRYCVNLIMIHNETDFMSAIKSMNEEI